MPASSAKERTPMAKITRSFMLNPELSRLVDALCDSTGASFTKIMTAALIRYLLGDFPRPDTEWMKLASALDRGELSVSFVLLRILEARLEHSDEELRILDTPGNAGVSTRDLIERDKLINTQSAKVTRQYIQHRADPLAGVIELLVEPQPGETS